MALVVSGPRGGEVAACCRAAVELGVRPGMPVVEAQSLVRNLATAAYDAEANRRALVKCAEACEPFSSRVAIEEEAEPESLLLDISNLEHLWGSEARLIETVKKFFTRRGYEVRVGVAETVGAAWAAAHFEEWGRRSAECGREAAEIATTATEQPPASSFVTGQSLFSLPVESLRISEQTAATLRELGLETVGQVMVLPREGLAMRFGDELLQRLDQLTGAGREVIEPRRAPTAFAASRDLEEPTGDRGVIVHVLRQLVNQLAEQLAACDRGAVLLVCSLRCIENSPTRLRVGLLQPSACARQLLELIELHLEAVKLASEVDHVELHVAVVGRLGERQGELFAARWSADPHQLAVLVNRLSSRLGYDCVLQAQLRASAVPERAVQWRRVESSEERGARIKRSRMVVSRGNSKPPNSENRTTSDDSQRAIPLLLYPTPQAREVVCVAPDGSPQALWFGNRRESIVSCVGPERIESLWWRGPTVRRDYYRVATESGSHLWMFRQLADGDWFVHGVFA